MKQTGKTSQKQGGARYTPLVAELPATVPFVGPETLERNRKQAFLARLGANENVFGPSPKAVKAMQIAAFEAWKYADPESHDLKSAVANHLGVDRSNVVFGEGIDGLLGTVVRLVVGQGDAVVTSDGAYPTFNYHVLGLGGVLHKVPYKNDHEDPEALIAAAKATDAKLIYLSNPDNPMGTILGKDRIQAMIKDIPNGCVLVLDEAYCDFVDPAELVGIDVKNPNVIHMRTFSKAYGLAGIRVGYALGQEDLIASFDKVRNHFGMSKISQDGALAALQDQAYLTKMRRLIAQSRQTLDQIAHENGLTTLPSATNFVAIDCGQDGDFARRVLAELLDLGIFARMPAVSPQDRCIRVSAGRPEDLALFKDCLPKALSAAS